MTAMVFCDLSLGSRIVLSSCDMSDVNSQISNPPLARFAKEGLWLHRLAVVLRNLSAPLYRRPRYQQGRGARGSRLADDVWIQHVLVSVVGNGRQYSVRA
jgi:hypothetical protein